MTASPALPNFYTDVASCFGSQAPTGALSGSSNSGNSHLLMHDNAGPLSLGSALAMAGGASFYNYGDMSNLGATAWDFCNAAPTTSIFSLPNTLSPLSDSSVYSTDESDLLLVSSDSDEFLQQINGPCSPITMHPNLVHTLKNMVAPGAPGSVVLGGGSGTMYSAQPSVLDQLEQLNRMSERQQQEETGQIHDRFLRSALLRQYCSPSVVPKVELPDLSPPVGAVIPSPVVTEEPIQVSTEACLNPLAS